MNSLVSAYIQNQKQWQKELKVIRSVLLKLPLTETIKWGIPVYTYQQKNILGKSGFKNYCGLWFYQGVFLKDDAKFLINAQKNKTKALRQIRFTSAKNIDIVMLREYVLEAIENCKAGKELKSERNTKTIEIPLLLKNKFKEHQQLQQKFNAFSLAKKREFTDYITSAKRETTQLKRIEKISLLILAGKSLYEQYKKN